MNKVNFLAFGVAMGVLAFAASPSFAADVDVDASITTKAAVALTKNTDMNFGTVEYDVAHTGTIELGTDGNAGLAAGSTGMTLSGTPTAGDVDVSGDGASIVDISCETGGTLTDGGANTLTLSAVEISTAAGGAAAGAGTACAGLATAAASVDLAVTATPKILMGASIDVTADGIDGSFDYDTANAGGDPVTLRVVYQ